MAFLDQPPPRLTGWTAHARDKFETILRQPPSDQQMRELLRLWQAHHTDAFLNSHQRWQVKVFHKTTKTWLWLVVGEQDGKPLLWTVFKVGR